MGAGLFLVVLGAMLAFAVKDEVPNVNLGVAGVILMLAGVAVLVHARATAAKERVVTRHEESGDPAVPTSEVEEIVREQPRD